MSFDTGLAGDSSSHTAEEKSPEGTPLLHRLSIRFTNGETLRYDVREPLHAEDIPSTIRFAVISSYLCESPDTCAEIILLNLNDVSYIKTEHITFSQLERTEPGRRGEAQKEPFPVGARFSRIGFI